MTVRPLLEIERRFLARQAPIEQAQSCLEIKQGYVAVDDSVKSSVRVRQEGDKYTLTIKCGVGVARQEENIKINLDTFERLWPLAKASSISKKRYVILHDSYRVEVDVFEGLLGGLVLAEVEFDSLAEAEAFTPPSWVEREVTEEQTFTNAWIARNGNPLHLTRVG